MILSNKTIELLEDIERRIDPDTEEDFKKQWHDFTYGKFDGEIFRPMRKKCSVSSVKNDAININDAILDYDLMLRSQLQGVSNALAQGTTNLAIRSNYGTGIMTSLFGAEIFKMPRETNTLPTTKQLDDTSKIEEILDKGMPDIYSGFGRNVFEFGELCKEVLAKYPKINKYVTAYHPDTQGPLDSCELLWGCDMFYNMYDDPDLVHGMLKLITDTYIAVMDKWYEIYPLNTELNPHWHHLCHRGGIVLRDDSAMNLSPEQYLEFALPYDSRLLEYYGGGMVHFCGRGDHYIELLCKCPYLYAINLSQPHYNDMEVIFRNTVDKGIKILGFSPAQVEAYKNRPGAYHSNLSIG